MERNFTFTGGNLNWPDAKNRSVKRQQDKKIKKILIEERKKDKAFFDKLRKVESLHKEDLRKQFKQYQYLSAFENARKQGEGLAFNELIKRYEDVENLSTAIALSDHEKRIKSLKKYGNLPKEAKVLPNTVSCEIAVERNISLISNSETFLKTLVLETLNSLSPSDQRLFFFEPINVSDKIIPYSRFLSKKILNLPLDTPDIPRNYISPNLLWSKWLNYADFKKIEVKVQATINTYVSTQGISGVGTEGDFDFGDLRNKNRNEPDYQSSNFLFLSKNREIPIIINNDSYETNLGKAGEQYITIRWGNDRDGNPTLIPIQDFSDVIKDQQELIVVNKDFVEDYRELSLSSKVVDFNYWVTTFNRPVKARIVISYELPTTLAVDIDATSGFGDVLGLPEALSDLKFLYSSKQFNEINKLYQIPFISENQRYQISLQVNIFNSLLKQVEKFAESIINYNVKHSGIKLEVVASRAVKARKLLYYVQFLVAHQDFVSYVISFNNHIYSPKIQNLQKLGQFLNSLLITDKMQSENLIDYSGLQAYVKAEPQMISKFYNYQLNVDSINEINNYIAETNNTTKIISDKAFIKESSREEINKNLNIDDSTFVMPTEGLAQLAEAANQSLNIHGKVLQLNEEDELNKKLSEIYEEINKTNIILNNELEEKMKEEGNLQETKQTFEQHKGYMDVSAKDAFNKKINELNAIITSHSTSIELLQRKLKDYEIELSDLQKEQKEGFLEKKKHRTVRKKMKEEEKKKFEEKRKAEEEIERENKMGID